MRGETANRLQQRFVEIMRRHIREDDAILSDDGLVRAVYSRYAHERGQPLIDPNE